MSAADSQMVSLDGGVFTMGSDRHYPEEAPARRVEVSPFRIDAGPVRNREFAAFVEATGYMTLAETPPNPADYPGMDPALAVPASLVFVPTLGPVSLENPLAWWQLMPGANWRHPSGPQSDLSGLDDHPVVHIAHADAAAYADWARKSLPTEAEWEFAARAGIDGADYAWGDELEPAGVPQANYWRGDFPWRRPGNPAAHLTSTVGSYPDNRYGISDLIGNVWEWTSDWWATRQNAAASSPCCVPKDPRGGSRDASIDPAEPEFLLPRKVLKGGSHLCAPSYCQRYRPAARYPQPIDTTTSHVGFRCVAR